MEVTLSQLHTRSKTFSKNPCSERFTKQTRVTTTCNLQLKPKGVIVACDGLQPPNNPCHPFNDHLACPNISSFYEHSVKYQAKVVFMKDKYQLHTRSIFFSTNLCSAISMKRKTRAITACNLPIKDIIIVKKT